MDPNAKAREVYHRLKKLHLRRESRYVSLIAGNSRDSFKVLVSTILSQNTSDDNSIRAYNNLEKNVGISVDNILKTPQNNIAEAIKIGGLQNVKAKKIREAAEEIFKRYDSDLKWIRKVDVNVAREKLISLPGVGKKTADIMLLHFNKPVFPIDTHIRRITRRLGLVDRKASYEEISCIWKNALNSEDYKDAHLQLIAFGREICRARSPKCNICPLKDLCKFYSEKYGEYTQG